jgi:hypothetical protein
MKDSQNSRQDKETRALAQKIRRSMITKVKPSGKVYSRKNK